MNIKCDFCGSAELRSEYKATDTSRGLEVYVCSGCALVQSFPKMDKGPARQPTVSSGALWGNLRYGKAFRSKHAIDILSRFLRLEDINSVLDIGSNRGHFLGELRKSNSRAKLVGVEPDFRVIGDYHSSIEVLVDRIENVGNFQEKFQIIYSSHTLEHLRSITFFRDFVKNNLDVNGLVYVEVPSIRVIEEDSIVEEFFIDKHLYHFSLSTFTRYIHSFGYEVLSLGEDSENLWAVLRNADFFANKSESAIRIEEEVGEVVSKLINYKSNLLKNKNELRQIAEMIMRHSIDENVVVWGAGRIFDSLVVNGGLDPKILYGLVDSNLCHLIECVHDIRVEDPDFFDFSRVDRIIICSRAYYSEIRDRARKDYPNVQKIQPLL